jgi:hypothetical protein
MVIKIPNKISSDYQGFNHLVNIYTEVEDVGFDVVTFDFSKCTWFEANLCALFGAICNTILDNINSLEFIHLNSAVKAILSKNEFLKHFGGGIQLDTHQTTIKYRRYKANEQTLFREYLNTELLSKDEMPSMSELLQKKINESIFEIFENAITHGKSNFVFSCGQYYPRKSPPRIDFTIVDLGNTIKGNVNQYLNKNLSAKEAIEWAVNEGNTTKVGNTPGGLGLKIIRKFLRLNKGEIQIVSDNGYWIHDKNNSTFVKDLNNCFKGTVVNLEFNIDDNSSYILAEELKNQVPDNIF